VSRLTSAPNPAPAEQSPAGAAAHSVPRFLLRRREAAAACGLSPATWDRLCAAGKTPAPLRLGGALVWRVAELASWVEAGCPPRAEWEARRAAENANGRR
jgi:predicted DNA-binding transcriptional regulator AlpA